MDIFSKRLNRLPPYMFGKLRQLTHERRQQGIDIIDLAMGNPNQPTPQPIIDKLTEAAQEVRNHRYSVSRGIYNLRREVSWHYERRFGVDIDPDEEAIAVIGTKEGLGHLALALIDNGDLAMGPESDLSYSHVQHCTRRWQCCEHTADRRERFHSLAHRNHTRHLAETQGVDFKLSAQSDGCCR